MTPENKQRDVSWRLKRNGERHFDYHNFDDLLSLAVETCLTKSLEVDLRQEPLSDEQKLLNALGVRGLSLALDLLEASRVGEVYVGPSQTDAGEELISGTMPLRFPERTNGQLSPEVQQKIEAFGTALLDEAYLSLGTDAGEKVRAFVAAESDEEQVAVLEWLDERVGNFSKKASLSLLSDDDKYFYHPARLSPRLIGRYPHNELDPTCLGKSLLTASFVQKTGAETLHAGVMKTPREEGLQTLAEALFSLAERTDLGLTASVRDRLRAKSFMLDNHPDTGFHAASLVRLKSGSWYVMDPNFKGSMKLSLKDSEQMQRAYDDIHGFGPQVKGIERTLQLHGGEEDLASFSFVAWVAFERMQPLEFDASRVERLLRTVEAEELLPMVRAYVHTALMRPLSADEEMGDFKSEGARKLARMYSAERIQRVTSSHSESLLSEGIEDAIEKFFLWEESPEAIVSRLQTDQGYLERKLEDLRALPYLVLANCALIAYDAIDDSGSYVHDALEVGATDYRIGAAVLSDFASYCGDNLSYSFWLAHWSSKVPVTERLGLGVAEHDSGVVHNNLRWLDMVLRYSKQNGITR